MTAAARLLVGPRHGRATLPALERALRGAGLDYDVALARRPGDAVGMARAARDHGVELVVAVGGDPTVHDVVNGLLGDGGDTPPGAGDLPVLGVAGVDCDFARTFGLDRGADVVARHLTGPHTMTVDIGEVACAAPDGRPVRRLFANVAQVGWGAELVRHRRRLPAWTGRVGNLLAAWTAISTLDRQEAEVRVAHTAATLPVVALVAANGQFFSGGMKVAPRALPDDGRLNVLVFTGPRSQVFTLTQPLLRGEHLPHPQITEWQSPRVTVAPARPLAVEADGRLLGRTPATVTLRRRALRVKV
ncbi:MAG: hypothetical protein KY434_00075 [Actinobacteria bacterium]|nr:hypothetical protein [Actinomycetota bacterium]